MPKAIRIQRTGGPEVLDWISVEPVSPGPEEVAIRHTAVGVNYIDVYHRNGLYPLTLPSGIGIEAAGTVTAVGRRVTGLQDGDRIAYAGGPPGAYAEERLLDADRVVRLPAAIDDQTAAALLLKGLTAHFLLHRVFPVGPDQTILVHAAAGGVGSLLCPWAAHLGARVIGTTGSAEKAQTARHLGCEAVIHYREEDVAARVRELTGGRGVAVVYDGVGAATFQSSLDSLAPRGMLVSFGNASGPVPAFAPTELARRGSLFFTRPSLIDYIRARADLDSGAQALFAAVAAKILRVRIGCRYPLAAAAQAHQDLEARHTTGSNLLLP